MLISAKHGTGMPQLVQRITELLPAAMQDAFVAQQHADLCLKEKAIRALIYSKAGVAAAVALVPIPVADMFILTPIQIAMVTAIGYFHGVEVTTERATELIAVMGAGVGFREAARQLAKLIPGYGSAVSATIAFAGTVALGEAANVWFKRQMKIGRRRLTRDLRAHRRASQAGFHQPWADVNAIAAKLADLRQKLAREARSRRRSSMIAIAAYW